jgi:hypothetical protein
MAKKQKTKTKKGRPATGHVIAVPAKFKGHEPRLEYHGVGKKPFDASKLPEPNDEASKHKYPPPSKHPVFREKWMNFIDNITRRENFHVSHLENFRILCDMYVEYSELKDFIKENGRTYCSVGRQGEVWKPYPEVTLLGKVEASIKEYSKMLGLLLKKDHGTESGGEGGAWD